MCWWLMITQGTAVFEPGRTLKVGSVHMVPYRFDSCKDACL